jgi:hypothetical protein
METFVRVGFSNSFRLRSARPSHYKDDNDEKPLPD